MTPSTRSGGGPDVRSWTGVDEGWGRRAADFATLAEPANCREYTSLHHRLGVGPGDDLLDVACGAGLALELAGIRGARCFGIDASPRLLQVARDRSPAAQLRLGDMQALPWPGDSFDVVTSFRGIWGTTPDAVAEAHRVLRPGGRIGLTVWGHLQCSPGAWALRPFRLASSVRVAHQGAMVALGRSGAGEDLLARCGFGDVERLDVPFAWEFADPASYARALASTGPAYEAIQQVGEEEFLLHAVAEAESRIRDGLPLRAEIAVVGYVARKPVARPTSRGGVGTVAGPVAGTGFLQVPETSPPVQRLYDEDVEDLGYVMNASRLWAHQPEALGALFDVMRQAIAAASLTFRERGVLVCATASALGDAYCSLAWGGKLASVAGAGVAAGVLQGDDDVLEPSERALARWARQVTRDPDATAPADVQALRDVGYGDAQILALTVFVGLRIAFSSVNDALGAHPDAQLARSVPEAVRAAVTFGRPVDEAAG